MTIEQHAEAAAEEIDRSRTDGPVTIIAKHMQSAIDEATSRLLARIAELEGLGPLIEEYIAETLRMFSIAEHSDEMIELNEQIKAILKGGAS